MYDHKFKTEKIETKDKIEPQHIHGGSEYFSTIYMQKPEVLTTGKSKDSLHFIWEAS